MKRPSDKNNERMRERSYCYETVDLFAQSFERSSVLGRSRPLTAASRANIGYRIRARVRNVTERRAHNGGVRVRSTRTPRHRRHVGTRTRALVVPPCVPRRDATPRVVPAISTLLYIRDASRPCKLSTTDNCYKPIAKINSRNIFCIYYSTIAKKPFRRNINISKCLTNKHACKKN